MVLMEIGGVNFAAFTTEPRAWPCGAGGKDRPAKSRAPTTTTMPMGAGPGATHRAAAARGAGRRGSGVRGSGGCVFLPADISGVALTSSLAPASG